VSDILDVLWYVIFYGAQA